MPNRSPAMMKARGRKVDDSIGKPSLSSEQRETLKKEKDGKKKSDLGPWILGLLLFVILGSSIVQIFQTIQYSPSMSDAR